MDYTKEEDLDQMFLDIQARKNRVRKRDVVFLRRIQKKRNDGGYLSFEELEKLMLIWDGVTRCT